MNLESKGSAKDSDYSKGSKHNPIKHAVMERLSALNN